MHKLEFDSEKISAEALFVNETYMHYIIYLQLKEAVKKHIVSDSESELTDSVKLIEA